MSGQLCEHTRLIVGAPAQLLTGERRLQYVGQERSDQWSRAPPLHLTSSHQNIQNVLKLTLIRPARLGLEANNAVFYVLSSI